LAAIQNIGRLGGTIYSEFDGQAVDVHSILVKYTWNGDADLTGNVDANDYFLIDKGFAVGLSGYANGDFDYSGVVDANDYFLIDNARASQVGVLGGAFVAVPEPSAGSLIGAAGLIMMARRRGGRKATTKKHEDRGRNTKGDLRFRRQTR
jgi:hypothetical protein